MSDKSGLSYQLQLCPDQLVATKCYIVVRRLLLVVGRGARTSPLGEWPSIKWPLITGRTLAGHVRLVSSWTASGIYVHVDSFFLHT